MPAPAPRVQRHVPPAGGVHAFMINSISTCRLPRLRRARALRLQPEATVSA